MRADSCLVVVSFLGAAGWWFSKSALGEMPPYSFVALRFLIAAGILALLCWRQLLQLNKQQLQRSSSTGLVMGLALLFWVIGLQQASSIGESAFIVSLTAVLVPIASRIIFAEKISRQLPLALATAVTGLVLLTVDNGFVFEPGQWYFLIAIVGFAVHLSLSSHFVKDIPAMANTAIQLATVGLIAAVMAVIYEPPSLRFSAAAWGWLLATAIVTTSFRFAIQNYAMPKISPSYAAMILLLEPIWTAILGALVLGEVLTPIKMLGCGLIFTALLVYRAKDILGWWQSRGAKITGANAITVNKKSSNRENKP